MRVRVRGPNGSSTIEIQHDATVGELLAQIAEKTTLKKFDIKYGYPPKPLLLDNDTVKLSELATQLDREQLIISAQSESINERGSTQAGIGKKPTSPSASITSSITPSEQGASSETTKPVSLSSTKSQQESEEISNNKTSAGLVALKRKDKETEVPELPLPDRGATLVLRVMPDDNSCLFRAFGTAVLPGDDLSMTELRSLVATRIQAEPDIYTQVVLEQKPDDYCRWIQTEDAWGGAIEMGILAQHFEIEICSIDIQSLRIDRFNEGRPTRCILAYSGIHYDTIVQSPSDPPHTKANYPPELDKRLWDADDKEILTNALLLCKKLQAQHYYTDTGGMAIKCTICGWIGAGQGQAQTHAQQTGHYDMTEVNT